MIQNTTFLRRAVGSLLVALVTLVGFQANAQLDFSVSTDITWNEDPAEQTSNLTALNGRINEAVPDTIPASICYTFSGVGALEIPEASRNCRPDGETTFTDAKPAMGISTAPGVLAVAEGKHVDYDVLTGGSPSHTLTVTANNTATKKAVGTVTIKINVTNYDEQPVSTQGARNPAPEWYLTKDESQTILISSVFMDPEGAPVYFNPAAGSTDVYVCDSDTAGDSVGPEASEGDDNARTATPADAGSITAGTGGTGTTACSVSNTDAANGVPGASGNRVVTTRKVGPILHITADSVQVDTSGALEDPNEDLADRPKGTYTAKVLFRVWTGGDANRLASSDWSSATVHVKIGANNLPQFAGGATGYMADMNENSTGSTGTARTTAWLAGDLDSGGVNNDMLEYSLKGQFRLPTGAMAVSCAGGVVGVLAPNAEGIGLWGHSVDFETAQSCTVVLQVTDNWSDPVEVPITLSIKDVNELNFAKKADGKTDKKIEDQRLIQGGKRTFDLDEYFDDPEDDDITFSAHTNIYTNVVSVGEGNVLTINGANTSATNKESVVTVTVVATDGKLTVTDEITVTTRFENELPTIDLVEDGTIAIGASVNENGDKGAVVVKVDFSDDDPAATPHLTGTGSEHFKATVNDDNDEVSITVDTPLNYEASDRHVLKLVLQDAWDDTKMSDPLEIQVSVVDQNDAPTLAPAYTMLEEGEKVIDDQMIVVNGSMSMYTGMYFVDEDGDRLLINADSSDKTKVTATEKGLDGVTIMGVALTEEMKPVVVTLTATDPEGASETLDFNVHVGANTPPVANADAIMAALPENNTVNVGGFADIGLDGLFTENDGGDEITVTTIKSSDPSVLLVVVNEDGDTATLVGRSSGMATITLIAMDGGGNTTEHPVDITVNEAPAESMPIDPVEMDRVTPHVVDISNVFTDGDDGADMLTITAEAIGEGMDRVTLEIMDGELTITGVLGVMPGDVEIQLTATDPHGATATSTFLVSVVNVGPTVAMSLEDITDLDRTMPRMLDVSGVFMDADGDMLTVTAEVKDAMIVEIGAVDEEGMLTVTALAVGMTSVVLTAVDADGASIMADFEVTVINIAPVVAEAITDQSTTRAEDLSLDVSGVFDDPDADNDMLTITVMVANEMYVSAMLSDDMLAISGLDVGTSAITLTATDADGGMVESMFDVTIDNVAPVVANSISPISLEVGGQAASQSISGLFMDDDDMLTYEVTSSNSGIASTSLTGMTAMVAPMSRGSTTITVTATDPHGASASVMGSVTVGDGELKAVAAKSLAGFGRAMLASVSSSVGSRLMNDARSSDLTLDAWAPVENQGTMSALTAEDRSEVAWNTVNATNTATTAGASSAMQAGSMSGVDALRSTFGQSFALNLGSTDNRSNWSVWGDIDRQSYEGAGYDGMASSIYLGADVTVAECWMFGVAVSTNSGESDYTYGTATQTMDMSLTTVLPYVSYQPSHGSSIWGVAGFGSGELETTVVGAANETSDLTTQLTLVGGSQDLTRLGRMSLALRGDAAVASVETEDGNGAADGLAADVNRIRVGLEGSFRSDTGNGGIFEPFGQVSLRSDGGDGDTGTGVEVAGGIRLTGGTFTLEAQGRTLAMHGADEYSESGFSLMAKLNPSASATGVSVSIAPRWGADALGNGMLWQDTLNLNSAQTYGALAGFGNAGANRSIDTQIGYGMLVASEQFLLTPFVDLGVSDSDRREMLLGVTLQQLVEGTTSLDVNLALGRVEERTGASSGKIGLNAVLRF